MMALKFRTTEKNLMVEIISYLFIVLFVYAAVSKLLDFEQFRVQIGQSPLLSAYAHWIAWAVPALEIVIAFLLISPRLRFLGLYASFSLMIMFTTYIIIILNFTDFIPCSCGGVLEQLGWTEHLVFNIGFILLALLGILLLNNKEKINLQLAPEIVIKT
jgi:uncharacterized membrane protein YphA (DoxX/SURF4 family)